MTTLSQMTSQARGIEEESLAWYLAEQVCARASGRTEQECEFNFPHDKYFIGNLRPAPPEDEEECAKRGIPSELMNKLAPVAFGAEFRIRPLAANFALGVRLRWNCYYRVFPTFEQQLQHQRNETAERLSNEIETALTKSDDSMEESSDTHDDRPGSMPSPETAESENDRRKARKKTDTLFIRFKKIECEAKGFISIRSNENSDPWEIDTSNLEAAIEDELARAQKIVVEDPENLKTPDNPDTNIRVPESALQDLTGQEYLKFCQSLTLPIRPVWNWKVEAKPRSNENMATGVEQLLLVRFTNTTPIFGPLCDRTPNVEIYLLDVEAGFYFQDCESIPFQFDLAPRGFRYDPNYPARGFNCNVINANVNDTVHLITTNAPIFPQQRYQTQTQPEARFADLAENPIPVLQKILSSMQEYLAEWERTGRECENRSSWNADYQFEYERDWAVFESEIERFEAGVNLIASDPDVALAFKLTNETFRRGSKNAWRLFQVVFLVSQIPGIAVLADPSLATSNERKTVDIIYFPTGGGKTEAYLGMIVFHCFFDRLRGKKAGITAWTRFPLRLLTLQQTQRVADVIGLAELVRQAQIQEPRLSGEGVAGFAVGYFVGSNATPNKLSPPWQGQYADPEWEIALDPDARQRWKRIVTCPSCGTETIIVDFDEVSARLRHRCTNSDCEFEDGYLPIYVVDNEVYRYLPSVVVGTIDKLAGIGNQAKMSLMLGQVDGYCTLHGYYAGKCSQDGCNDPSRLKGKVPQGLSGPTLFVQDELHLLKEGLGTFDSHYETFLQALMQELGQKQPLKVVASSATIEAFERQVEHLYGRAQDQARVFPGNGPELASSFYAETLDYAQRLFVGIIPHNKTIFNAILELLQYYHEEIQRLKTLSLGNPNPFGGIIEPGTDDWRELLDVYETSVTYFLNTRDLHSIKTDLEAAVNGDMQQKGYLPLLVAELTGSVSTSEVATTLARMERKSDEVPPDSVLATNMISHGVDIDRLNSIIFYGMPAHVAEYIQSSSRVGRAHCGLVFMCLHPAHERDQSHYTYFLKFHEFLGQLVEPVAINRWSRFSITRTLPGLFMAIVLQLIAGRSGEASRGKFTRLDFVKKQIRDGKIRPDDFIPLLQEAYQVRGMTTPEAVAFRDEIELRVGQFFDQILGAGANVEWVSDALIPSPMRSLREVDEQLIVELDDNGTLWASRV